MKINCGPTFKEKLRLWREWHPWFAWKPVRIGENDCRWLETVERREVSDHCCNDEWSWEYRALTRR